MSIEPFKCADCGTKYNIGEDQAAEDMTSEIDSALCKWCGQDDGFTE